MIGPSFGFLLSQKLEEALPNSDRADDYEMNAFVFGLRTGLNYVLGTEARPLLLKLGYRMGNTEITENVFVTSSTANWIHQISLGLAMKL